MEDFNLVLIAFYVLASLLIYWLIPKRYRAYTQLLPGMLLYMILTGKVFAVILLMVVVAYFGGQLVSAKPKLNRLFVPLLLLPMVAIKILSLYNPDKGNIYQIWFTDIFSVGYWSNIIGISYFTFNILSYMIDIKRGFFKADKNPMPLLNYLFYLPALISGPLHRKSYLTQQLSGTNISWMNFKSGMWLILWGMVKFTLISQNLKAFVFTEELYNQKGIYLVLTSIICGMFLYANFSSFIDIVRGLGQLFGMKLKDNFKNRIYWSNSRTSFWTGWHITLNEWFRDYLLFPLWKNNKNPIYREASLLFTFVLIGLWHQLTLAFLIWGLLNGIWIILERRSNYPKWPYPKLRERLGYYYHLPLSCLLTLLFFTYSPLLLFQNLFSAGSYIDFSRLFVSRRFEVVCSLIGIVFMEFIYRKSKDIRIDRYFNGLSTRQQFFFAASMIFLILYFGKYSESVNVYGEF